MSKANQVVVQLKPNHPRGQMNRFWYRFTEKPSVAVLDDEQVEYLKKTGLFIIPREWSAAWNIGLENPAPSILNSETPVSDDKNEIKKPSENVVKNDNKKQKETDVETEFVPTKPEEWKKMEKYNKAELVYALEQLGLVREKDFQIDAANKMLLSLLQIETEKRTKSD